MSTIQRIVARCTISACVAVLSLATCTTALADPGNGNGGGPGDAGPPAQAQNDENKDSGPPGQNQNDKVKEPGPSDNANDNAKKKADAPAVSGASGSSENASANSGGGGSDNTDRRAPTATGGAPPSSSGGGGEQTATVLAAPVDPGGGGSPEPFAAASTPPGQAKANSPTPGNGGANASDATLGLDLGPGNRGTAKIHLDATNPLDRRNQPKVGCFDVTGFHFDPGQNLSISIVGHGGPNAGGGKLGPVSKQSDQQGNLLLNSQSLPVGMYKLTVATNRPGGVKHKVFKVTGTCPSPLGPGPGPGPSGEPPEFGPPSLRQVSIEGPVREARPGERPEAPKDKKVPEKPEVVRVEIPLLPVAPGVAPAPIAQPTLAFTGFDTADLALIGGTVLALGLITVLAARRRAIT